MYYEDIHIGKKIQYVFNQSGLTVSQFARMLEVQRTRVYNIFDSKSIDIDLLCKVADALHYDFLSEVYIKKRESADRNPLTINVHFQVATERLSDFIKSINKLKNSGIILN
jgi:transcriptional regulator with XRE-family HTH domain